MFDYEQYFRREMMPHIWCKGCGNGVILKALLRAVHRRCRGSGVPVA
jgi:2-oxoglutarate ferredoxin oxidoreductase subunit beta